MMENLNNCSIPTAEFMMELIASKNFDAFCEENRSQMVTPTLSQHLTALCESRGVPPHELIRQTDIDRIYGYNIFSGNRKPSRDYILKLALGLQLNIEETQKLLTIAKHNHLYPRVPRDAAVLYCLYNEIGYQKTQECLYSWNMSLLGDSRKDEK